MKKEFLSALFVAHFMISTGVSAGDRDPEPEGSSSPSHQRTFSPISGFELEPECDADSNNNARPDQAQLAAAEDPWAELEILSRTFTQEIFPTCFCDFRFQIETQDDNSFPEQITSPRLSDDKIEYSFKFLTTRYETKTDIARKGLTVRLYGSIKKYSKFTKVEQKDNVALAAVHVPYFAINPDTQFLLMKVELAKDILDTNPFVRMVVKSIIENGHNPIDPPALANQKYKSF